MNEMEFTGGEKMHVVMRRMRNEEEQLRNHLLVSACVSDCILV
jgi:hypothetical protein